MGLLKKNASAKPARSAVTIIAEGNKFSGEMNIVGKMHIDGVFEGKVNSLDMISVGKRGQVVGRIKARQISVCGHLEGEIECEELLVEDGGKVRGIVRSEVMSISPQGCFVGERQLLDKPRELQPAEAQPALSPALDGLPDKVVLNRD